MTWATDLPADVLEKKREFAFHRLRLRNDGDAIRCCIVDNPGLAEYYLKLWKDDPFVLMHMEHLKKELGAEYFLPSKYDLLANLADMITGRTPPIDRIKAIESYAKLNDMYPAPKVDQFGNPIQDMINDPPPPVQDKGKKG